MKVQAQKTTPKIQIIRGVLDNYILRRIKGRNLKRRLLMEHHCPAGKATMVSRDTKAQFSNVGVNLSLLKKKFLQFLTAETQIDQYGSGKASESGKSTTLFFDTNQDSTKQTLHGKEDDEKSLQIFAELKMLLFRLNSLLEENSWI